MRVSPAGDIADGLLSGLLSTQRLSDRCLIRSSHCAGGGDVCACQGSTKVQRRRRQSCPVVTHFVTQAHFDPLLARGRRRQLGGSSALVDPHLDDT
jgi:hypothetical protein